MNGMPLPLAGMVLLPEPWQGQTETTPWRDLYRYYSTMMEPWDGPAAILYSDGDVVCASLDRNGLRPLRCALTDEGRLILSSEAGALHEESARITRRWRLNSGGILVANVRTGETAGRWRGQGALRRPAPLWRMDAGHTAPSGHPRPRRPRRFAGRRGAHAPGARPLATRRRDIRDMILPMAANGVEPTASIGRGRASGGALPRASAAVCLFQAALRAGDEPAHRRHPPKRSRPTRASISATTATFYPPRRRTAASSSWIRPSSPPGNWSASARCATRTSACAPSPCSIPARKACKAPLKNCSPPATRACREGANIVILSDRGLDGEHMAIPSLLAVVGAGTAPGARKEAHRRLRAAGERRAARRSPAGHARRLRRAGGKPLSGARMRAGAVRKRAHRQIARAGHRRLRPGAVLRRTQGRLEDGRFHPAGLPERAVVRGRGPGRGACGRLLHIRPHCLGGTDLRRIEEDSRYHHDSAFSAPPDSLALPSVGRHRQRRGEGAEEHLYSPEVIHALQQALCGTTIARSSTATPPWWRRRPAHHPLAVDLPLRVLQARAAGGS